MTAETMCLLKSFDEFVIEMLALTINSKNPDIAIKKFKEKLEALQQENNILKNEIQFLENQIDNYCLDR